MTQGSQDKEGVQVVILAAGRGTRMLPLTETRPKPMQEVSGKNLIEWKLEALPKEVTEVIIVVGYQGEQIQNYFGSEWQGKTIRYVEQKELNGTAGAVWAARDLLTGRFLVMMGDDLYGKKDIENMLHAELAIGGMEFINKEIRGEILVDQHDYFSGIVEPIHVVECGIVNTGLYMLDQRIFSYDPVRVGNSASEFGLPHTLVVLAKDVPVHVIRATKWLQVTTPDDLQRAENFVAS